MNTQPKLYDPTRTGQIPTCLKELHQWINWKYGPPNKDGKLAKLPLDPHTGKVCDATDPASWGTFEQAESVAKRGYKGIGFAFKEGAGCVGIDLDHVVDLATGAVEPAALAVVKSLGSYTEYSTSGTGLHVLALGKLGGGCKKGRLEVYDQKRYFVVTGNRLPDTPTEPQPCQQELEKLYQSVSEGAEAASVELNERDLPELEDDEVLEDARCYDDGTFELLWAGKWQEVLTEEGKPRYPSDSQHEADLALCRRLAKYTGDRDQIDRLFRQSKLYRDKWETEAYRNHTIDTALGSGVELLTVGENEIPGPKSDGYAKPLESRYGVMGGAKVVAVFGDTKFVWPGHVALGHVSMIVGPQGVGKTRFGAYIAAALTGTLSQWPDGCPCVSKRRVLLIDTEGMRAEIFAILGKLGCQEGTVVIPTHDDDPFWIPSFPRDAKVIEQLAVEHQCGAVIIDSLSGGHRLDENNAAMRRVLQSCVDIAIRLQCAMILVHHVNKRREHDSIRVTLDRVRGSSTITQFCRCVIATYRLVDDLTAPTRVEVIKTSFGKPPKPFGFSFTDEGLILFGNAPQEDKPVTIVGRAVEFLKVTLSTGPMRYSDLQPLAEAQGISKETLYKARRIANVTTPDGRWTLPGAYFEVDVPLEASTEGSVKVAVFDF